MKRIVVLSFIINICLVNISAQSTKGKFDAGKLLVEWQVIENGHNNKTASLTAISFTNSGKIALPANGWSMYFNFARPIESSSVTGNVKIDHINGDLFKLTPNPDFKGVQAGEKLRIEFVSSDWVVNFTDAPAGFFIVWDADNKAAALNEVTVLPSTEPKQYLRFPGDKIGLVTPADIYKQNDGITDIAANDLPKIFPSPMHYKETGEEYIINATVKIAADDIFNKEATFLSALLGKILGKQPALIGINETGGIRLQQKAMAQDAYELQVSKTGIIIYASGNAGAFYAIQSLQSLFPPLSWSALQKSISVPGVEVSDSPRFGYRAYFLDVARHYQPKKEILKLIDLMTLYKLNVLHLHLTEDEGWRIEIPSIPELTTVGSKRGFSANKAEMLPPSFGSGPDVNNPYATGFYSKKDFIEILRYATDRHIQVIPEIETPGHARAAIMSMASRYEKYKRAGNMVEAEKYLLHDINDSSTYSSAQYWNDNVMNVSLPSVYRFIETVVNDVKTMYKEAGAPLTTIHMGGDEVPAGVWEKSPACKALIGKEPALKNTDDLWYYYYGKVNNILQTRGLFVSGWEEAGMRKTLLDGEKKMIANPDFGKAHFQLDVWNNVLGWGAEDLAYQLANAGYKVVLSCVSNNYFDMAYYKSFDEPGYYWGGFIDVDKPFYFIPYDYFKNAKEDKYGNKLDKSIFIGKQRLTDYGKSNIVGIKGLLWAENMKSTDRVEYMTLPKILGIAERAWAKDPEWAMEKDSSKSEILYRKDWNRFVNQVGKRELPRLEYYSGGFNFRIPTPGLVIENGSVLANIQLPGLQLRYTTDGKEPTAKSKLYSGPIAAKGTISVKAFDARGRSGTLAKMVVN